MIRSLKIEVYPKEKTDWPKIRAMFAEYRAALRKAFAAHALTECAAAEIIPPKGKRNTVLKATQLAGKIRRQLWGGKSEQRGVHPFMIEALPSFNGMARDCATTFIMDSWKSNDPEFPTAPRGYLIMQGARKFAVMGNADIRVRKTHTKMNEHGISLCIFADQSSLELKVKTLDPGRWGRWKKVVKGDLKCGDPIRLGLRDGNLFLYVPFHEEDAGPREIDATRIMEVSFGDTKERAICLSLREGHKTLLDEIVHCEIDANGAWAGLLRQNMQKEKCTAERKACGRRGQIGGIGHERGYDATTGRLHRLTVGRDNFCKTWNHVWTKRIVKQAHDWRCGKAQVFGPPADLCSESWPWADFRAKLDYKAKAMGLAIEYLPRAEAAELKKETTAFWR